MTDEEALRADGYHINDCTPPYGACSECNSMHTMLKGFDEGDGLSVMHVCCLDCGYDFWE